MPSAEHEPEATGSPVAGFAMPGEMPDPLAEPDLPAEPDPTADSTGADASADPTRKKALTRQTLTLYWSAAAEFPWRLGLALVVPVITVLFARVRRAVRHLVAADAGRRTAP